MVEDRVGRVVGGTVDDVGSVETRLRFARATDKNNNAEKKRTAMFPECSLINGPMGLDTLAARGGSRESAAPTRTTEKNHGWSAAPWGHS